MVSPQAQRTVMRLRAARPQPWWPRCLGALCIGVACMFALDPVGSIPADVAASSSTGTGPRLASPSLLTPDCRRGVPQELRWRAGSTQPPFTLILLDASYTEVLRRDGIEATRWEVDPAARELLRSGGRFHGYVLADGLGRPVGSPLTTFQIAGPGTSGGIVR